MVEAAHVLVRRAADLHARRVPVAAIRDDVGQHVFGEEGGDCLCDARGEFGIETAGGFRLHDGVSCMPKIVARRRRLSMGAIPVIARYHLLHLLRPQAATMHRIQYHFAWESIMKKLPQCVSSPVRLPWQARRPRMAATVAPSSAR